ncbi:MAG: HAD-IC family P-type ATPase [Eubacteriales bacterium]|nr:HAD-IC family P-type ATPase [Eubacteriales bacterium]MDD3882286.1 HAD-IC family P-type ATPase [Eubacteriales bacterium]MDD4512032.1 HAD-IC family P-type ATPase [Eubacteriales bacterium]
MQTEDKGEFSGLSGAEVQERRERGEVNTPPKDPGKTVWQIFAGNLFTLFNALNLALAVCLLLVGSYRNMLFMGVVISNAVIGTYQELRAKRALSRLQLLNAPRALVIRDGKRLEVAAEELVTDDILLLRAGQQVPADGIVVAGSGAANESLLTGEADPVAKDEGAELMSGSYICEGSLTVRFTRVGDKSYVSELLKRAKAMKRPVSSLMSDLRKLIRIVSIALVPTGILLFAKQYFLLKLPVEGVVPSVVAAMIGMIPEGLMLLTSIAMAVGVVKLARKKALVQELYGIETLARVDTLCLDKTGTITSGKMRFEKAVTLGGVSRKYADDALSVLLRAFPEPSPTMDALRSELTPPEKAEECIEKLPFSSQRKLSAVTEKTRGTIVIGAANFVLDAESSECRALMSLVEKQAAQGLRVLLICESPDAIADKKLPDKLKPLCLYCIRDELRDNVQETLAYFREQGVTLKVISGDDPVTVSRIAAQAGLQNSSDYVDMTVVPDGGIAAAAENYTVFGRVTPVQKEALVKALHAQGHSVAMTGDGVNDIPALKAADCSIAMAGGSDAAKNAAQITLLGGDFSVMPQIVAEGRRVVNNITRAASLFLVKTIFSLVLSLLLLALPWQYPFQPIQLTLISSLTVGLPSFVLALEPNDKRIRGNFLQNVLLNALPGALAIVISIVLAHILANPLSLTAAEVSTVSTLTTGFCGLCVLFSVCLPLTYPRAMLVFLMAASFYGAVLLLGRVFFLSALSLSAVLLVAGLSLLGAGMILGISLFVKRRICIK